MRTILACLTFVLLTSIGYAVEVGNSDMCPIKRFIEPLSPTEFSDRFKGDTIFFSVPDAENSYFETFKLLIPDTIWLKKCPKHKLPQEHKHFKLIKNYSPVPGWGVNAHRQYTPGLVLEKNQFIFRGSHTESIQYLGTFSYVLLEDVASGKLIKWDYAKNENKGLVIFSPSIIHHLSLMKGKDFIYEKNDTTFVPVKCVDVAFSISVKPKKWVINLDADFVGGVDYFNSRNWNHKYFIKND